MAESFELRENSFLEQPALLVRKRRIWLRVSLTIVVFAVGTGCGWYFHGAKAVRDRDIIKEVHAEPDISVEFQAGLDEVMRLFPDNAEAIQAQKADIINYMLNMTDPPEDSPLQKALLTTNIDTDPTDIDADPTDRRLELRSLKGNSSEDTHALVNPNTSAVVDYDKCFDALAQFAMEVFNFITGFVYVAIPSRKNFKKHITRWLKGYTALQLGKAISTFAYNGEVREKVKAMWMFFIQTKESDKSLMKALFDWLVKNLDPWKATKAVIRLATQVAIWYGDGVPKFINDVIFHAQNFEKMLDAAKNASTTCNFTFPSLPSSSKRGKKRGLLVA